MTIDAKAASEGEGTELYRAGCESLVSESSAASTFLKMISCAFGHSSLDTFTKEVRQTEKQIKEDFAIPSMPGPWRSAKSVITTSMTLGLKLIDDNGSFVGKTFLQNRIKEIRSKAKEEWTNDSYAKKIIMLLINIPSGLDVNNIYAQVKAFVDDAE